jgi:hypothetical protein
MYGSLAFWAALYQFWWNTFVMTLAAALNIWLWNRRNKGKRKRARALVGSKARAVRACIAARQCGVMKPGPATQPASLLIPCRRPAQLPVSHPIAPGIRHPARKDEK